MTCLEKLYRLQTEIEEVQRECEHLSYMPGAPLAERRTWKAVAVMLKTALKNSK